MTFPSPLGSLPTLAMRGGRRLTRSFSPHSLPSLVSRSPIPFLGFSPCARKPTAPRRPGRKSFLGRGPPPPPPFFPPPLPTPPPPLFCPPRKNPKMLPEPERPR